MNPTDDSIAAAIDVTAGDGDHADAAGEIRC